MAQDNTDWDNMEWDEALGEFVSTNKDSDDEDVEKLITKDSQGHVLKNGDTVCPIKDLKVKGMSKTLKIGFKIKNIKLTDDPDLIECKIGKSVIVLKTEFFKKI